MRPLSLNLLNKTLFGSVLICVVIFVCKQDIYAQTPLLVQNPDSIAQETFDKPFTIDAFYQMHAWLPANLPLHYNIQQEFQHPSANLAFYVLATLLLFLGIIRVLFPKYIADLFLVFFQSTFRQKAMREQLLQNKTASLFLNGFFLLSSGLFLFLFAANKGWVNEPDWWWQVLIFIAMVGIVYGIKYIAIQASGWLFGLQQLAENYIFIVFLVNKVVGLLLLPSLIVMWLHVAFLEQVLVIFTFISLIGLLFYRYVVAIPSIRTFARISSFHFFIYLCAFEIVPVAVMYKFFMSQLGR